MLDPAFVDRLDALLAGRRRRARPARYPGARAAAGSRCTPCYVPADRFAATTVARVARRRRWPRWTSTARCPASTTELDGPGARQARRRADRGPAHRLRGRLRRARPTTTRTPPRGARRQRALGARAGAAPPFVGHADEVARGADPPARACARSSCSSRTLLARGALPAGFRVTLPKVTLGARRSRRWWSCARRSRPAYGARPAAASRSRSRRRRPSSARTAPRWSRGCCTPAAGRCVGLHYGTYDYSAALGVAAALPVDGAPGGRPRQGRHAGGRGRHRRAGVATARPTSCRSATPTAVRAAWALHARPGPPLARARLLPGLGPAPGPAADPVRRHLRLLPRRAGGRAGRLRATATAPTAACWTSRPPPARWPTSCSAGIDCGALTAAYHELSAPRRHSPGSADNFPEPESSALRDAMPPAKRGQLGTGGAGLEGRLGDVHQRVVDRLGDRAAGGQLGQDGGREEAGHRRLAGVERPVGRRHAVARPAWSARPRPAAAAGSRPSGHRPTSAAGWRSGRPCRRW